MPLLPRTWSTTDYVTAMLLNTDLYTYVPFNNQFPNGILFHALNPTMHAFYNDNSPPFNVASAAAAAGATTDLQDTVTGVNHWGTTGNTEAMFTGSTGPYQGQFVPSVPGSDGVADSAVGGGAGNYLFYSQIVWNPQTNATGYASAGLYAFTLGPDIKGGSILPSTTIDQMPWCLDLTTQPGRYTGTAMAPQTICQDASANSFGVIGSTGHTPQGTVSRAGYMWCGVGSSSSPPLASGLPAAVTNWPTATSALLNSGVSNPLKFLNNKPQLRVSVNTNTGTVGTGPVILDWGTVDYDNYSGFSTGTALYTVPVDGVYLVYCMTEFNDATSGQRRVGVQINGSLQLWGVAASSATGSGFIRPQMLRLLDLKAGDTVSTITVTSGNSGNVTNAGRMVIVWMSTLATSGTPLTYTPPDVAFRWPAGNPGNLLVPNMNKHLGNDIAFLLNKPYVLAYQTTAQTGLLTGSGLQHINCQNNTGRVHGSFGDNYGGWNSSTFLYTAPVPGWYLAVGTTFQNLTTTLPFSTSQSFRIHNSVGTDLNPFVASLQSCNTSSGLLTGGDGLLFIYLNTGDTIFPEYSQYNGTASFNTVVATGTESHFGLVWVSE